MDVSTSYANTKRKKQAYHFYQLGMGLYHQKHLPAFDTETG
jgi:hypothetical protein